jgi:hypothetical protein
LLLSGIAVQGISNSDLTLGGYQMEVSIVPHTAFNALSTQTLAIDIKYSITVHVVNLTPAPTTATPTTATPTGSPTSAAPTLHPTKGVVVNVCRDSIAAWTDSEGDNCQAYTDSQWCTSTGAYGSSWGTAGDTFATSVLLRNLCICLLLLQFLDWSLSQNPLRSHPSISVDATGLQVR